MQIEICNLSGAHYLGVHKTLDTNCAENSQDQYGNIYSHQKFYSNNFSCTLNRENIESWEWNKLKFERFLTKHA